ncbi:PREDICTED: TBC1 domain family member 23 [Nicrophorus vespilloides]|uniref:TBC1 domain family member 23 n=1 Tax=Nicrophorus vespilloides TaxID=110193 RepID=A0ABM1MM45_NICVS|nr:PREDICTED: TBC1 domain family member 23 [Nicrophorus vespilloides]
MSILEDENATWIQELENVLLEECTASDIYCLCKGKPLPDSIRQEVWQVCLDVRDKGNQIDHFNEIFDLPNQVVLREDCANFVSKLGNDEAERPSIVSDLESILTFYCKSRSLQYERGNGWIELLLPIITLKVGKSTIYNLFEGIRDMYIPQGSHKNGNVFHILRLLLLYHDPELCNLLDTKKLTPDLYCLTWFQSLFAATCNLNVTITMWDYYLQQSDPFFVFFLSLIMVINAREQIISMKNEDKETLIKMLTSMPNALEAEDVADFCSLAQYYAAKTPVGFRTDLMQSLYSGKGDDISLISQALCLPVSVQELVENSSMDGGNADAVRFFIVDCRPVEQYNAGHLSTAFHLDCNLMLQEPSAFQTAVQGLLNAQKQALAMNSNAGGEHLCFLGSGRTEEDQYTLMVVASFLQKHTQYVSILTGGFISLHDYFGNQCGDYLQDHVSSQCMVCGPLMTAGKSGKQTNRGQSNDLFGKISAAMKNKSAEVKGMLFEYIVNPNNSPVQERHVSSSDKQGKRYRNVAPVFSIDDDHDNVTSDQIQEDDERQFVSIQSWLKNADLIKHFPCQEVKLNGFMYKSHLMVTDTHLVVLREIPDKKGTAEVIVKRPLTAIVKITAKKRHPDLITFKYGVHDGDSLMISDMDSFLIPEAHIATKVVTEQILKQVKTIELLM